MLKFIYELFAFLLGIALLSHVILIPNFSISSFFVLLAAGLWLLLGNLSRCRRCPL